MGKFKKQIVVKPEQAAKLKNEGKTKVEATLDRQVSEAALAGGASHTGR